jgi:hypothetical protein
MFKINKEKILDKFKDFIETNTHSYKEAKDTKEEYSQLNYIRKILQFYIFAIKESKLDIRREFVHNDKAYKTVIGKLQTLINNKIRSTEDGKIYIKVNNEIDFDGNQDQYIEWIINDKSKQQRLMRKVIEEINFFLENGEYPDENKPLRFELTKEETIINILIKSLPESIFDSLKTEESILSLKEQFEKIMIKLNIEKKFWEDINFERFVIIDNYKEEEMKDST